MSNSEEDEYCGADYETLDQWTARHIEEGREKWGHGNCFDWLNPGAHCFGCHYNHPQLTLAVTGFASDYEGPGANRRGNVGADSKDAFDDEAALALVAEAEAAEASKAADDVIDWDAVGAVADAARAEHDAKRARVL